MLASTPPSRDEDVSIRSFINISRAIKENDEAFYWENINDFIFSIDNPKDVICVIEFYNTHARRRPLYAHLAKEILENYVLDQDNISAMRPHDLKTIITQLYPRIKPVMSKDDRLTWISSLYEVLAYDRSAVPLLLFCLEDDRQLVLPFMQHHISRYKEIDRRVLSMLSAEENDALFQYIVKNVMKDLGKHAMTRSQFKDMPMREKRNLLQWAFNRTTHRSKTSSRPSARSLHDTTLMNNIMSALRNDDIPLMTVGQLRELTRKIQNPSVRDVVTRLLQRLHHRRTTRHDFH
jgi:hypothetical protein